MINQILALTNKYVPLGFAIKGLGKINPKFEKFFTSALASGYTADAAMGYLKNKLSTEEQSSERQRLEQESAHGTLRPDEKASLQTIKESERLPNVLQKGAAIGIGALTGGLSGAGTAAASAIASPGESPEQPEQQSPQGPGGFMEFIKQNPELGSYLDQLINKGVSPLQAATEAKKQKKFMPVISSIEKNLGQPFESLLSYLFQGQQQAAPQQGSRVSEVLDMLRKYKASRVKA